MCGCSTRQPVEAWPNVVNTQFLKFSTILFAEFLRLSTKMEDLVEISLTSMGVHIWPSTSSGLISFPDQLVGIPSLKFTTKRPLKIKANSIQKLTALNW
ncbi:unnamed protein product [Penicillium nalgiovense]|nr:unnamed protein product [Penicillium nalgiovense]